MAPATLKQFYNWTLGCIGMTNPDIRDLYQYILDGTPVQIAP
jgi:lipoprotein-anchoring transpeptidase ErfK/SrfK